MATTEEEYDLISQFGCELWYEIEKAEAQGLSQKEFNDRMNDPNKYQVVNKEEKKITRRLAKSNEKQMISVIISDDINIIEDFIEHHDINSQDRDGMTLLMRLCVERKIKMIEFLLTKKPNVDIQSKDGITALHLAVIHKATEAVELLVEKGCLVDIQDKWGNTALWRAASQKNKEIYDFLISYGASPDIENNYNRTPKEMAKLGGIIG